MEENELQALRHGVGTLLNDAWHAEQRLISEMADMLVGPDAPRAKTAVMHPPGPKPRQELFLVCGLHLAMMRHIGQRVADVVHPIRVARDRVQRVHRDLDLSSDVWPIDTPLWRSIERIDNFSKHETPPPLYLLPENVQTWVYTADRRTQIARLPVELSPQRIEGDVAMYRIVESIPKKLRGDHVSYLSTCSFTFMFGKGTGIVADQPVNSFLEQFRIAGNQLLPIIGYPRDRYGSLGIAAAQHE